MTATPDPSVTSFHDPWPEGQEMPPPEKREELERTLAPNFNRLGYGEEAKRIAIAYWARYMSEVHEADGRMYHRKCGGGPIVESSMGTGRLRCLNCDWLDHLDQPAVLKT